MFNIALLPIPQQPLQFVWRVAFTYLMIFQQQFSKYNNTEHFFFGTCRVVRLYRVGFLGAEWLGGGGAVALRLKLSEQNYAFCDSLNYTVL